MVELDHDRTGERVDPSDRDRGVRGEHGDDVERRVLPPVRLAGIERRSLGHRVGDVEPFDAVDLDDLAARRPARRLLARNVVGILDVDDPVPGLELLLDKFERARADHLGNLLERVGVGEPLRHHEQRQARHLAEAVEEQRKRLLEPDREAFLAIRLDLVEHGRERLPVPVARHPALDRGDAVGAAHRRAVMEAEPVAQPELISELVGRNAVVADHLRVRRELGVDREQRVEHHVAVVSRDVCGRPHRIEDAQIRLGDKAQRLGTGTLGRCFEAPGDKGRCPRGDPEFATRQSVRHVFLHCSNSLAKPARNARPRHGQRLHVFSTFHIRNAGAGMTPLMFLR